MTTTFALQEIPERLETTVALPASKSLSNRALILQALSQNAFNVHNLSGAADTKLLADLLEKDPPTMDCDNAGTALRFLTAYAAITPGQRALTGSSRMQQRPIGPLVNGLRALGAQIEYKGQEGYPPVLVKGQALAGGPVELDASVSSQFVTALLLIAPFTQKGVQLTFTGIPVSRPYFAMTIKMLQFFNVKVQQKSNEVAVSPKANWPPKALTIEPDWSSASYWVGLAALLKGSRITFPGLGKRSWQGDQAILDLTSGFGIQATPVENGLQVSSEAGYPDFFEGFLTDHPDLVPTLAALCTGARVPFRMQGLPHLKDKETDRLHALQQELEKAGAAMEITDDGLACSKYQTPANSPVEINTYADHRMAMSSVILAPAVSSLCIADPHVVDKSYPGFWDQLADAGFVFSSHE